jgi:hypothetical protein
MTGALPNPVNRPGSIREKRGHLWAQASGSGVIARTYKTRHTSIQCVDGELRWKLEKKNLRFRVPAETR